MFERMKMMFTRSPSSAWLKEQNKDMEFTPDWWNISQFRTQLFFAYGNDMPERCEYDNLIGEAGKRLGRAYTAIPMTLFSHEHGFPIALESEFKYNSPHAPYTVLAGELLRIKTEVFRERLDAYYANGKVFRRKRVDIAVPLIDNRYSDIQVKPTEGIGLTSAWTYVGIEDYWNDHLDGGYTCRPAKTFNNLFVKEFYFYGSYDFSPN